MVDLMAFKNRNSLSTKVFLAGLATIIVFASAIFIISDYYLDRYVHQIYQEKAITVAHLLDSNIRSSEEISDNSILTDMIQRNIWLDTDILSITIFPYQDGQLSSVISNRPKMTGIVASENNAEAYKNNKIISEKINTEIGPVLRVYAPVHVDKFLAGTIQFDLTLENLEILKKDIFKSMVGGYILFSAAIIFLLILYIRKHIIKPVAELESHVHRVAGGDFNSNIPVKYDDEIGRLCSNFNVMADSLEQQRNSILQAKKDIEFQATHDTLTGLPNRFRFRQRLIHNISFCQRYNRQGALILMDLDQFKGINDSMGHQVGDRMLVQVAERLNRAIRQKDMLARLGGDEFVVIISEVSNDVDQAISQIQAIAQNILKIFSEPFSLHDHDLYITTSIGIVLYPSEDDNVNEVIKHADTAMYKAKEEGGNCSRLFDQAMQDMLLNKINVLKNLRKSIKKNLLQVFYQPQVNDKGEVKSAEALVRWMHPEKGLLLPDDFIGIAESNGLIHDLGDWVLNAVCQQFSLWQQQAVTVNNSLFRISVNVSSKQFHQKKFCENVMATLEKYNVPPQGITLEVTESALLNNFKDAVQKIEKLKEYGIQFSIDDFGTGFSSLAYLQQLPLDEIKIDRSFIVDMLNDSKDAYLVKSIINLSHSLDLKVVAEGVENEQQFTYLKNNDCHLFQGFLFKEPLSVDQFKEYLSTKTKAG